MGNTMANLGCTSSLTNVNNTSGSSRLFCNSETQIIKYTLPGRVSVYKVHSKNYAVLSAEAGEESKPTDWL